MVGRRFIFRAERIPDRGYPPPESEFEFLLQAFLCPQALPHYSSLLRRAVRGVAAGVCFRFIALSGTRSSIRLAPSGLGFFPSDSEHHHGAQRAVPTTGVDSHLVACT